MSHHRAPLTSHHADGTACPPKHRHTTSGKPLDPNCPGRDHSRAVCTCGNWEMKDSGKGYVDECRKRHLAAHRDTQTSQGPAALRELLRFAD